MSSAQTRRPRLHVFRRPRRVWVVACTLALTAGGASAQTWNEVGDAPPPVPAGPPTTAGIPGQITAGNGPLQTITGTILNPELDVDIYCIHIQDRFQFQAQVTAYAFTSVSLFLFDFNGLGVTQHSGPPAPAPPPYFPSVHIPPAYPFAPGRYWLAVAHAELYPSSTSLPAALIWNPAVPGPMNEYPWPPNGPGSPGPVAFWPVYPAGGGTGPYTITLSGAEFCQPCTPAPPGMVAWWPLDELMGPTAVDIVGGHNGTQLNGPAPLAGQFVDNSLCFDGVNDYVEAPDAPALNFGAGNFSIDAWIRTTLGTGVRVIVDKRTTSAPGVLGYSLFLNSGLLSFQLADGAGSNTCASCPTAASCTNYSSGVGVATGNWTHVAVTVSRGANGGTFYVNGASVSVFDPSCHPNTIDNTSPLRIGSLSSAVSSLFQGCIDEVELFARELTPAEVAAIFNAGQAGKCKCRCPGDLVADGVLNGLDIAAFVNCWLNAGMPTTGNCLCADFNRDGVLSTLDVTQFVSALLMKQPC